MMEDIEDLKDAIEKLSGGEIPDLRKTSQSISSRRSRNNSKDSKESKEDGGGSGMSSKPQSDAEGDDAENKPSRKGTTIAVEEIVNSKQKL